jgi:hypothetical protein
MRQGMKSGRTAVVVCWVGLLLCVLLALPGCGGNPPGQIQGIRPYFPPGEEPSFALETPIEFEVFGTGSCESMTLDFGDGVVETKTKVDLAARPRYPHTFTGWRGGKTVSALARLGCVGQVNTRFNIEPPVYGLGWAFVPDQAACHPIPNRPNLPARTRVRIDSPDQPLGNFGCAFNGCINGIDGPPGQALGDSRFPFPNLKAFSLVVRVGTQVVQGGKGVVFVTNQSGPLESCINTFNLHTVDGGWTINYEIDMLGPVLTP